MFTTVLWPACLFHGTEEELSQLSPSVCMSGQLTALYFRCTNVLIDMLWGNTGRTVQYVFTAVRVCVHSCMSAYWLCSTVLHAVWVHRSPGCSDTLSVTHIIMTNIFFKWLSFLSVLSFFQIQALPWFVGVFFRFSTLIRVNFKLDQMLEPVIYLVNSHVNTLQVYSELQNCATVSLRICSQGR